jgi:hypothetical protein
MTTQAIEGLERGELSPYEAMQELNRELCGITRVVWNPGTGEYKVYNHEESKTERLPVGRVRKRTRKRLQELAMLSYWQEQRNGESEPGEIHINAKCSSKHHRRGPGGFNSYLARLIFQYTN